MDRLKWLSILLIFLSYGANAKGLHTLVGWKEQNTALNQKLSSHQTLFVSTYQNFKKHNELFNSKLKDKDFSLEVIMTDKDQSPTDSTGDIVKALRDNQEKQNLVCMGKAAADCLEALLQYPEFWEKINYFVSIDGKISGAEYAEKSKELVTTHDVQKASKLPFVKAFRFLVDAVSSLWDGHDPAVHAMNPKVRMAYLEANDAKIEKMAEKIHTISMTTKESLYWEIPYSKVQYFVSH